MTDTGPSPDPDIVMLLLRAERPDPNDTSTWRVDGRPLSLDELALARRVTASDVREAAKQALLSAGGWDQAQRDTETLIAFLTEYTPGLDLEGVSKEEGLKRVMARMPDEVRARADQLLRAQEAYDVMAQEEPGADG